MNMKKISLILLLSIGLIGCSSIEISTISPSDVQTDRIIALGLTHEENLVEARKLSDLNLTNAVIKELNERLLEADQDLIEFESASRYAENVLV